MKIEIKQLKKWIKALDSGKYEQCTGALQNKNGYCCLGVACKVLIPNKKLRFQTTSGLDHLFGDFPKNQPSAPKWLKEVNDDFENKTNKTLSLLNDQGIEKNFIKAFTFSEIATVLELVYIHKILD